MPRLLRDIAQWLDRGGSHSEQSQRVLSREGAASSHDRRHGGATQVIDIHRWRVLYQRFAVFAQQRIEALGGVAREFEILRGAVQGVAAQPVQPSRVLDEPTARIGVIEAQHVRKNPRAEGARKIEMEPRKTMVPRSFPADIAFEG